MDKKVGDQIIVLLSRRAGLTPKALHIELCKSKRTSLQAVYKELSLLEKAGVVVKYGRVFQLHLAWVLEAVSFADKMAQRYFSDEIRPLTILEPGEKLRMRFESLLRLNDVWSNLTLNLIENSETRKYYSWNPYTWCDLLQPAKEEKFYRSLRQLNVQAYKLIGGSGYLDRVAATRFQAGKLNLSFRPGPFRDREREYLSIVDDCVINVSLDQATTAFFRRLYQRVQKSTQLSDLDLIAISRRKINARLVMERNQAKANQLRKKFEDFF